MKFGLQVSNIEWNELRDLAQTAEGMGFDAIMLPDHIVYEGPERQSDAQHLAYDPILQAAIVSEATRRVRIGHLVLCNLFRHPWFTAQCIGSLDHLSGGRAFLGLGSGWTETEFRMTGLPFPDITTRLRMLDEALTCIRGLWTQERTTCAGEFYQLRDAIQWPKPLQRPHPPILLGGSGKGLLRVAARHADVVNIVSDVGKAGYIALESTRRFDDAAFRDRVRFVRAEAARAGRDPQAIRISQVVFQVMLTDSPAATRTMADDLGAMFGGSGEEIRRSPLFLLGTPDECVAELQRRGREWDLSEVVFSRPPDAATLRRLAEDVLAHV